VSSHIPSAPASRGTKAHILGTGLDRLGAAAAAEERTEEKTRNRETNGLLSPPDEATKSRSQTQTQPALGGPQGTKRTHVARFCVLREK
jgi:hypothetical protein